MYSQIFLVTSVRGLGEAPITAASAEDGVIGFMNAAFGLRFVLAFAAFLAGAFLFVVFFAADFLTDFFDDFFAFAILKLLDIVPVNHIDSTPDIVTFFAYECKGFFLLVVYNVWTHPNR